MTGAWILARLQWTRMWRGRTLWVTGVLAAIPPGMAALVTALGDGGADGWMAAIVPMLTLAVLLSVAIHLAPAVGEELEQKTHTYLFSRPIDRGALLVGKALAVLPVVFGAFAISTLLSWVISGAEGDLGGVLAAVAVETTAGAAVSLGAGTLFPRRPLGFVLAYVLLAEQLLRFIPGLVYLSVSSHAFSVAGIRSGPIDPLSPTTALIAAAAVATVWLIVAFWRVEMAEYSSDKE